MKDALFQVSLASFCFFLGITLLSFISFIKDRTLPVKWAKVQHFSLYSLPTHKGRYFSFCYVRCLFFFQRHEVPLALISCSASSTELLLWGSVAILSLLWLFCPFSDHLVPSMILLLLFWVCHMQLPLIRGLQTELSGTCLRPWV